MNQWNSQDRFNIWVPVYIGPGFTIMQRQDVITLLGIKNNTNDNAPAAQRGEFAVISNAAMVYTKMANKLDASSFQPHSSPNKLTAKSILINHKSTKGTRLKTLVKTQVKTKPTKRLVHTATIKLKDTATENHQITQFFPIRRSERRTRSKIKKEKQKAVEDAILTGKEGGLRMEEVEGKGRAVFTCTSFKRGDYVVEYSGELIGPDEAKRREFVYSQDLNTGCYMYYFTHNNRRYCVDATKETERFGRLVNHSRQGNLVTKSFVIDNVPHLILVASRDIEAGEELLYDYGDRSKSSLEAHPWLAT